VPAPDSALPLAFDGVSFVADGVTRLDGVSFVVGGTPIAVVLGPNGAGKSLLLRLAAGLLAPSRGRVRWLGAGAARARERSAVVLQRPVLLRRSVRANLDYAMSLRGIPRSERAARGERALETSRGDIPLALGLGMLLIGLSLLVSLSVEAIEGALRRAGA